MIQLSHLAGKPIVGWKYAVLLYLREYIDKEDEELINWAEEMEQVRLLLGLRRGGVPRAFGYIRRSNEHQ